MAAGIPVGSAGGVHRLAEERILGASARHLGPSRGILDSPIGLLMDEVVLWDDPARQLRFLRISLLARTGFIAGTVDPALLEDLWLCVDRLFLGLVTIGIGHRPAGTPLLQRRSEWRNFVAHTLQTYVDPWTRQSNGSRPCPLEIDMTDTRRFLPRCGRPGKPTPAPSCRGPQPAPRS